MKKIFYIYLLLPFYCFSQSTLSVKYETLIMDDRDVYGICSSTKSILITNNKESQYTTWGKDTIITSKIHGNIISTGFSDKKYSGSKAYKDLIKGEYFERTFFQGYVLKDSSYKVNWTITDKKIDVLGYSCQQATGYFRGRNYKVYFTTELPFFDGPQKFDGLPGLILLVLSDDETIKIKAKEISKTSDIVLNPFIDDTKFMDWETFRKKYKKYFEKMSNYKPDENTTYSVSNRGIEYYVD